MRVELIGICFCPRVATGLGSALVAASALAHLLLPGTLLGMLMPAILLGAATGGLLIGFTQLMYREVGTGGNVPFAVSVRAMTP